MDEAAELAEEFVELCFRARELPPNPSDYRVLNELVAERVNDLWPGRELDVDGAWRLLPAALASAGTTQIADSSKGESLTAGMHLLALGDYSPEGLQALLNHVSARDRRIRSMDDLLDGFSKGGLRDAGVPAAMARRISARQHFAALSIGLQSRGALQKNNARARKIAQDVAQAVIAFVASDRLLEGVVNEISVSRTSEVDASLPIGLADLATDATQGPDSRPAGESAREIVEMLAHRLGLEGEADEDEATRAPLEQQPETEHVAEVQEVVDVGAPAAQKRSQSILVDSTTAASPPDAHSLLSAVEDEDVDVARSVRVADPDSPSARQIQDPIRDAIVSPGDVGQTPVSHHLPNSNLRRPNRRWVRPLAITIAVGLLISASLLTGAERASSPGATDSPPSNGAQTWEAGWGPEREMYTIASGGAPYPVFNSISDNENLGDERYFVGLRRETSADVPNIWHDDVWAKVGETYVLRVFVNNAGFDNNGSMTSGWLHDVRAQVGLIPEEEKLTIFGLLSAANSISVWDGATIHFDDGVSVEYEEGSAILENKAHPGALALGDEIISEAGVMLGYQNMDGVLYPGYEYAGYVSLRLKIVAS